MPRTGTGSKANRTDLLTRTPQIKPVGQPNGRPIQALVPTGLPYGEHQQLTKQISAQPRKPGPPTPPPPTSTDYTQPGAAQQGLMAQIQGRQRPGVVPMGAPTERPDEPITAGSIGQPDSLLGPPQPTQISQIIQQMSMLTGSAAMADLATRLKSTGH